LSDAVQERADRIAEWLRLTEAKQTEVSVQD
jgi:hypothetical protein